jgi:putative oligomerization/nucleic acid binding protein
MFARRRPLARAAVVGGTAYVAGKAGAKAGANQAAEQQQQYAAPPPAAAPAPVSGGMSEDSMAKLQQLADLHTQGVLTDAEFEVQKQKILQGM